MIMTFTKFVSQRLTKFEGYATPSEDEYHKTLQLIRYCLGVSFS